MACKSSRVQSNLLQQNCFVRDVSRASDLCSEETAVSYVSLDDEVVDDGIRLKPSVQPYHVTTSYVNSFVESADYRNDPLGSIQRSSRGVNLGDIREVQNIQKMDLSQARELYSALAKRLSEAQAQPAPQPASHPVDNENKGV